ncbi:MAG: family 2 glycosyl transferase [Cyclobacteriaceae bacterium]
MRSTYLTRYAYPVKFISEPPPKDLGIIITIPCFNEPNLILTLDSLKECSLPNCAVEIIVVINEAKNAPENVRRQNQHSQRDGQAWCQANNAHQFNTHILYCDGLPTKHAGVGLARKIAMDEAVRRFEAIGNPNGIIACFDADSTCQNNYLVELEKHFRDNKKSPGCSIYFEHPLENEPIAYYELFLRYYVNALRYAGFPYAYQTIGSSMAVRSWAYLKQGGMNRKKAGEDFYFLHRIIPLGDFSELNSTMIIPSSRKSDRVPFGTGRAMMDWEARSKDLTKTYNPKSFEDLKILFDQVDRLYQNDPDYLPNSLREFLSPEFYTQLQRLRKQSKSVIAFRKHFFGWFDGFKVLKFIHFARDEYFSNVKLTEAAEWLFIKKNLAAQNNVEGYLLKLRIADKGD